MSNSYRMIFNPVSGSFELLRVPSVAVGGAGTVVTAGVLSMPSGTQVECVVEFAVVSTGGTTIEEGSTLLIV